MNSLREIEAFTGVTTDAGQRDGVASRSASIRSVGNIVPLLSSSEQSSMRAMIQGLQQLPPISLEAEFLGDTDDHGNSSSQAPFLPHFRISPSSGAVLETVLVYIHGAERFDNDGVSHSLLNGKEVLPDGEVKSSPTLNDPGDYVAVLTRTGVTNVGVTVLDEEVPFYGYRCPPPDPVPPFISVQSKGDGSFVVNGSGFLPNASVFILVGDGTLTNPLTLTVTSDPTGKFSGFQTGNICTPLATRFFLANDGRLNPSNHSQVVSNQVRLTCPAS